MLTADYYRTRAVELEVEAGRVSDVAIRASYIELARSFREMANLAKLAEEDDEDILHFVERMTGRPPAA